MVIWYSKSTPPFVDDYNQGLLRWFQFYPHASEILVRVLCCQFLASAPLAFNAAIIAQNLEAGSIARVDDNSFRMQITQIDMP
jgi:hypothetical protein